MVQHAALLGDEVFPARPIHQWVLTVPFSLCFLFAAYPERMGRVLGIVAKAISTHLARQAGFTAKQAPTGALTPIQRFGSALNLNIRFHILFLDVVYVLAALPIEYIPATKDIALDCIRRLKELGDYEYNLSPDDSHRLQSQRWWASGQMLEELQCITHGSGDVYARLTG